jgi:hypothetical protein
LACICCFDGSASAQGWDQWDKNDQLFCQTDAPTLFQNYIFIGGTLLTMITELLLPMYQPCSTWLLPQVSNFSFKSWVGMSAYLVIISHHFSSSGNTEIITNSVVILFICDLDELLYGILMVCSCRCVESMSSSGNRKDLKCVVVVVVVVDCQYWVPMCSRSGGVVFTYLE